MDDDKLKRFIKTVGSLAEQFVKLAGQLSELRASVNVLLLIEASRLYPDAPLEGLKQLQVFEKALLNSDPNETERKEVSEVIDALKALQRAGKRNDA